METDSAVFSSMERVYPEGPRYCKLAMSIFNALEVSAAELRLKLFAFLNDEGRAPPLKLGVVGFSALQQRFSLLENGHQII